MGADPAPVPGVPSPGPVVADGSTAAAVPVEPAGHLGWRWVAALFALAFAAYLASPVHQNGDSYLYFPTARSLLHDRTLDLDAYSSPAIERNYGLRRTPSGHDIGYFPWAPSLFLVPVVAGLDAAEAVGVGPGSYAMAERGGDTTARLQVAAGSAVSAAVVALIALVAFDRLSPRYPYRRTVAVAVAVAFAFGTSLWSTASRALWQHGPSLLALGLALWAVQRLVTGAARPRPPAAAALVGASLAAAYAFRPGNSLSVALLGGLVALQGRREAVGLAAGAAVVAGPWLLVNRWAYGSLLQPYYSGQRIGWHPDIVEVVAANLVSPARGLFVFSPFLLLAPLGLRARWRGPLRPGLATLDRLLAAIGVLHLLAVSAYAEHWWGGHSYGPRFMTDVLVYAAALATPVTATLMAARATRTTPTTPADDPLPHPPTRPLPGERWARSARWRVGAWSVAGRRPAPATVVVVVAFGWALAVHAHGAVVDVDCWNVAANPEMPHGRVWSWHDPQFLYREPPTAC